MAAGAGLSLWRLGQWRHDGAFFASVLRERPDCHTAHYSLGTWYAGRQLPDLERAREHYREAVSITGETPASFEARLNLAISWELGTSGQRYGTGSDLSRAAGMYREMIELFPDRHEPHLNLAIILDRRADRGAVRHFQRVLELRPDHPQADNIRRRLAELGVPTSTS